MRTREATSVLHELPFVGRAADLEVLSDLFREGSDVPSLMIVTGEGGIGKSRLVHVAAGEAGRRGWTVAHGCAYPVESGMPYALISDALLPILREMDDAAPTVLSRGRPRELLRLFPALGDAEDWFAPGQDPEELRSRVFWTFTEFLTQMGRRQPLLLVLEDLHWADPSTLSLVHFVARQLDEGPVRILASYNSDYRDGNAGLALMERSLLGLRRLRLHRLDPLSSADTADLLTAVFGVTGPPMESFRDLLYGWTKGNPYFIEQILTSLVDGKALYQRDGTWLGWEARQFQVPTTVRDAILLRFRDLGAPSRTLADTLAVVGSPAPPPLLARVGAVDDRDVAEAVGGLIRRGLVEEQRKNGRVVLDFRHPLARETLYREISLTRREQLHRAVGNALEEASSVDPSTRTDELAYHFSRAGDLERDTRARHYLAAAGRAALARHADREASDYLEAALAHIARQRADAPRPTDFDEIRHDLARARRRLGDFEEARSLWLDLRNDAEAEADSAGVARATRHLGLLAYWMGHPREALSYYEAAREALGDADPATAARLDLAAGVALQELGEATHARERVDRALALGEQLGDAGIMARAHRALALLETWVGEAEQARRHGWKAVELSRVTHDDHVAFWGRWALAALEGLTGDITTMQELMEEARTIAQDLHSPVLGLWVAELDVELAYAHGDWDGALARGERAIHLAESLNQGTLLARLKVWTAMVYLGRGDYERARQLIDEAWHLSRAEGTEPRTPDLHAVLPAYIGRATLHLAEGRYDDAIAVGERGLALADRSGYVVWVMHRLLPVVGEAYLRVGNLDGARRAGARLRAEGDRIGHRLGLAWAGACDAIVAWHSGQIEEGARLLRQAAEALEAMPMIPEATRIRRQLAGRLADLGDREGALTELRRVHEVFGRLGAEPELRKAREQFRELEARPPSRGGAEDTASLTGREAQIATLVAARMSNKAIARKLDISPRTVTTHLSNIYRKLEIGSRNDLTDRVREGRLTLDPDGA